MSKLPRWEKPLECGAEGATAPETLRQKDQRRIHDSGEKPPLARIRLAEGITISGDKDRGGS
jgi:hypothetical protein